MLKNNAVLATIVFAFAVTVASISYTFYQLYQTNRAKHIDNIFTKHSLIGQIYHTYLLKQISEPMFEANLGLYDLDNITEPEAYKRVIRKGKILKTDNASDPIAEEFMMSDLPLQKSGSKMILTSMIEYNDNIYFWLESTHHSLLLEDRSIEPYNSLNLISAYGTIMAILTGSFVLILYRLAPLRRLRRQIARFGEGDMGVSFRTDGSDEIALISNELENTQRKIRSLIESRTLFLRNIMHELKTPIAKGRIAATMISDEKQQTRFVGIFERLESLIGEFALIEEITSGNQHIEKGDYRLIDIIDGAVDLAMVDYESVECDIDAGVKIEADYRLFVTAVKNLIDNGIKYSPEKKLRIRMEGDEIVFANFGEPLRQNLSYYIEPFTRDQPHKDSFGLGLYIVDAILKEHGYVLAYERRGEENCFIIVPEKPHKGNSR